MNTSYTRHTVEQGSEEWHNLRLGTLNASEAPVMMGCHPNMSRDELLRVKATKEPKEYSRYVAQKIFPEGHRVEALARQIISDLLDDDLYVVTCTAGMMLASFDGLSMSGTVGFECKQWNKALVQAVLDHQVDKGELPDYIRWQLDHQFAANPKLKVIYFTVSDGTKENTVWTKYVTTPERQKQLYAGWDQFVKDVAAWTPPVETVETVGVRPETMPALFVDVVGELTTTGNLAEFQSKAFTLIDGLKKELETDQDFADAESSVKWLEDTESAIAIAKKNLLAKTVTLNDVFNTLDTVSERARKARLFLTPQIKNQKEKRRDAIVDEGKTQIKAHMFSVNTRFIDDKLTVPEPTYNLHDVIKGKRSLKLMREAVNSAVASIKTSATMQADAIAANLQLIKTAGDGYMFLFSDLRALVLMERDHLELHVAATIRKYLDDKDVAEQNRVAGHQQTIASINAAISLVGTDLTLQQLSTLRKQHSLINTGAMEEFEAQARVLIDKLNTDIGIAENVILEKERQRLAALMQPLSYGSFFIVQIDTAVFRVKKNASDDYALHHGSFPNVDEAKAWCDSATTQTETAEELEQVDVDPPAGIDVPDDDAFPDMLDGGHSAGYTFASTENARAPQAVAVKISRRGSMAFYHGLVDADGNDVVANERPTHDGFILISLI